MYKVKRLFIWTKLGTPVNW